MYYIYIKKKSQVVKCIENNLGFMKNVISLKMCDKGTWLLYVPTNETIGQIFRLRVMWVDACICYHSVGMN